MSDLIGQKFTGELVGQRFTGSSEPDVNYSNEFQGIANRGIEGLQGMADLGGMLTGNMAVPMSVTKSLMGAFGYGDEAEKMSQLIPESQRVGLGTQLTNALGFPEMQEVKAKTSLGKFGEGVSGLLANALMPGVGLGSTLLAGAGAGAARAADLGPMGELLGSLGATAIPGAARGVMNYIASPDAIATARGKALQINPSEYLRSARKNGVMNPAADEAATLLKGNVATLADEGMLSGAMDPKSQVNRAADKTAGLNTEIERIISVADEIKPGPVKPTFTNAEKYISQAATTERPLLRKQLKEWKDTLSTEGDGSLSFLQQQKKKIYELEYPEGAKSTASLDKAVAKDIKETIEKTTGVLIPEEAGRIKDLNRRVGAFEATDSIRSKALAKSEGTTGLDEFKNLIRTSGGYGLPMSVGTMIGGPAGTAVGFGVGMADHLRRSPTGQKYIANIASSKLLQALLGGAEALPATNLTPSIMGGITSIDK